MTNETISGGKQSHAGRKTRNKFLLFLLSLWFDDCQGGLFAVEVTANHRECFMCSGCAMCRPHVPNSADQDALGKGANN